MRACCSRAAIPQQLFDLAMGIERWTYRVAAYTSLMTGDYPPFRLDVEEGGSPRASAIAFT